MTKLSPPAGSSLPQARPVDSDFDSLQNQHHSDPDSDTDSGSGSHILSPKFYPQEPPSSPPEDELLHTDAQSHTHSHTHSHSHQRRLLRHTHRSSPGRAPDDRLQRRQAPADSDSDNDSDNQTPDDPLDDVPADSPPSLVTQVVQTVSLIQVVDGAGSPVETQTFYAPPATVLVDPASGVTVAISAQDLPATSAAPAADPAPSDDAPAESDATDATQTTTMNVSTSLSLSSPPSLSQTQSEPSLTAASASQATDLTSDLSNVSSVLPPAGGGLNATNTNTAQSNGNVSSTWASDSSMWLKVAHSTTSSPTTLSFTSTGSTSTASSDSFSNSHLTTTSLSESIFSTISSDRPTITEDSGDGGASGGGSQSPPTAQADSNDSNDGALSPQEKKVIGGVVGGVAGAAFFLLLVLMALRYKRRKDGRAGLNGPDGAASRGITDGGPGGGDGSGGDMAERSAPFGLTSALAGLAGKRNAPASTEAAGTGERGFYRVSGRKLPSVLQAGGDGYTDPRENQRESVMSAGSDDYYRGSQAFEPISGGSTRLALGSPMRPVSGVVVMRSGPARTAVTENPFADPHDEPPSPPPVLDPVGRSLTAQDGSRGSGSRFQEEI